MSDQPTEPQPADAAHEDADLERAAQHAPEALSDELAREIAERWDPERILKLVARRAGSGEALDASLRSRYERRLGVDLSHVRVYSGELAEEVNKSYAANAVTIGNTGMILMGGSAEKAMGTTAGQALLAHELTHVAQAQRGVFRDASDMPLATEENEAEAERAEAQELSEARGGGAEGGNQAEREQEAAGGAAQFAAQVKARVLDMLAEAGRLMDVRGGDAHRRP